mmetsp:Transcript_11845/g.17652  ORF Transcript_11845/g.17652 Transcript_11845/m.17652 type:complete len:209 (-) Transcript_11845:152-778(-)
MASSDGSGLDDWSGKVAVACEELKNVKDLWVFGYGSLIWKQGFPYVESRPGYVKGYMRRFWQASTDHRGRPEFPGRVVTLVPEEKSITWGRVFRVAEKDRENVINYLDVREKGGYSQRVEPVYGKDGSSFGKALFYLGTKDSKAFVDSPSNADTAKIIAKAEGPSGKNVDYLNALHDSLDKMEVDDPHVKNLYELVLKFRTNKTLHIK